MTASAEPASAHVAQVRVPDFFIVGHHKCGTTALWEMLRRHPQIFMPELKEPKYFATDLRFPPPRLPFGPVTLEDYLALFAEAKPEQRAGEASPMYLWSRVAASMIADVQPAARIIAILREPATFLHSLHNHWLFHHIENEKDLHKALSLEDLRREGRNIPRDSWWPQALLYSDQVRYVEQLRRYHAVFPPEQVLVLIYDDFRADNEATMRRVLRFLEVDDTLPLEVMEVNRTKARVRAVRIDAVVRALYAGRGPVTGKVKATVRTVVPRSLRHDAFVRFRSRVLYGEPRAPDENVMLELRRRFKGEVFALSEYLGRDLVTLWGYDRIG